MHNIVHTTLREQIADAIKVMVIKHDLEPGMRIIESEVAKKFGVSHGPVREALRQLEQEGIVEYTRNAGCSIKSIDPEDIIEALMIRCNLEYIAVRACKGKLSDEALEDFRDILQLMKESSSSDSDPEEIDAQFHRILILNAGMPHLMKAWDELEYVMTFTFSNIDNFDEYMALKFYNNHKTIYDAFESGDMERIFNVIYNHYENSVTKTLQLNHLTEADLSFSLDIMSPYKPATEQ